MSYSTARFPLCVATAVIMSDSAVSAPTLKISIRTSSRTGALVRTSPCFITASVSTSSLSRDPLNFGSHLSNASISSLAMVGPERRAFVLEGLEWYSDAHHRGRATRRRFVEHLFFALNSPWTWSSDNTAALHAMERAQTGSPPGESLLAFAKLSRHRPVINKVGLPQPVKRQIRFTREECSDIHHARPEYSHEYRAVPVRWRLPSTS
jgi:hypothetical protein